MEGKGRIIKTKVPVVVEGKGRIVKTKLTHEGDRFFFNFPINLGQLTDHEFHNSFRKHGQ